MTKNSDLKPGDVVVFLADTKISFVVEWVPTGENDSVAFRWFNAHDGKIEQIKLPAACVSTPNRK